MDISKLILTGAAAPPIPLEDLNRSALVKRAAKLEPGSQNEVSEAKRQKIAKDFESVLLSRLLDEMKNTIGDWGMEQDGASKQVQGIFWMCMARDIAGNGGLGIWKDIYKFMTEADTSNPASAALDKNL
jgi:Rod binding domain-containing protein